MMAGQSKNNSAAYRIINVCLVLILSYSIFIIAVFLRAKAAVCSTTSPGVDLSIALSLPTIAIVGIRCYLIIRQRSKSLHTISPSKASPRLESACAAAIQFLVLFWVILAAFILLVAVRAPICLNQPLPAWQNNLKEQNWRYGLSCRLHRGLVAFSVLLAFSLICLSCFDIIDQQQSRRGTSLVSCYFTCRKPINGRDFAASVSSSRSGSSFGKDPLYLIPERRSSRSEMEHWQRRHSLSSQKAIYPHRYQSYDQRLRYASNSLPPSRYSSTLRSVSEGHSPELSDRYSSMSSSQSGKTWATVTSTRPSTTSSLPRSRAGSNPERGDLRREKGTESNTVPNVPPLPTLPPPAWAPTLQHTPLSADPTLRALSTGKSRPNLPQSKSSPDLNVQPLIVKKRESATPATTASTVAVPKKAAAKDTISTSPRKRSAPPMPTGPPPPPPIRPARPAQALPVVSIAPAIPARAPGHSARPSNANFHPQKSDIDSTRPTLPTNLSSTSSNQNLRRPDPIRHRQYPQHQHPYPNSNGLGLSQTQLHLQQYQHQRVWRQGQGQQGRNPSVYSASSYGTHGTDARSVMTRGSRAGNVGRPGTSGRV